MPGTYSQILFHIVFSTKQHKPWITSEVAERLYPYLGGIVRTEKAVRQYIAAQAEHHQKQDFTSELLRLLRLHDLEFDQRYVFDCVCFLAGTSSTLAAQRWGSQTTFEVPSTIAAPRGLKPAARVCTRTRGSGLRVEPNPPGPGWT